MVYVIGYRDGSGYYAGNGKWTDQLGYAKTYPDLLDVLVAMKPLRAFGREFGRIPTFFVWRNDGTLKDMMPRSQNPLGDIGAN